MSSAFTSSGLMRPWYRVKLRSRTWAKVSTRVLASSTRALPGCLRAGVAADASGFGVELPGAWSTNVPLGCSPATRAMSQVTGAPFWPADPLVMVNDSRTLMPSDSIRPATSGARNMTRPSVSVNITRSPYWPLMVLPCEYFRGYGYWGVGWEVHHIAGWAAVGCGCHIVDYLRPFWFRPQLVRKGRTGSVRRGIVQREALEIVHLLEVLPLLLRGFVPAARVPVRSAA